MTSTLLFAFVCIGMAGTLAAGIIALFGGNRRGVNQFVQSVFAFSSVLGLGAAVLMLGDTLSDPFRSMVFSLPTLSLSFVVDVWTAFFLILINIGTFLASVFALGYLPKYTNVYSFPSLNFASALFMVGMQAVVLSGTVFAFLLFWEIMSVAAYFLVIADREEASLKAGFMYFVMTHLGVAFLFIGFFILTHGDLMASFATLHGRISDIPVFWRTLAFFMLFAGFGSKAGLVPLHQWLPYAHPQAPSHSSALMSGVMLKIAVYGFLRVVMAFSVPLSWAVVVVIVGLVSAFFGVLSAVVETDLKRLLAWSSVENLGLVFTMIGMGLVFYALGMNGIPFIIAALLHILNHTIFKSGLFLAAGAIISETHTRDLDEMGGLAKKWPVFSIVFLGLVFAAAALPPFGTFYGEWMMFQGLASSMLGASKAVTFFCAIVLSIMALVGGLAIFTFVKTFATIFLAQSRSEHADHVKPLSSFLTWPVAFTSLASLGIGAWAGRLVARFAGMFGLPASSMPSVGILQIRQTDGGVITPMSVLLFFILLVMVVVLFRRFFTNRQPARITGTWDCGQPITPRMEYTATGFAAPIRFFFRSLLLSNKALITEQVTTGNPWILRRKLEWKTLSLWEEWIYTPIVAGVLAFSRAVKRMQNGVIQFYIFLIFATLVVALVFAV